MWLARKLTTIPCKITLLSQFDSILENKSVLAETLNFAGDFHPNNIPNHI
jgi:hypothetical protein